MYLQMTEHLRGQESRLFISFVAPYKGVSKDTISRWMRTIMTASGIDSLSLNLTV
jgi:predicted subunit of tRNA(5-methylaminomethyl-2-thiouridylate) methyltransferase